MYVVHHNALLDSFRIRISFFKNRIVLDSKNPLSDHLWYVDAS